MSKSQAPILGSNNSPSSICGVPAKAENQKSPAAIADTSILNERIRGVSIAGCRHTTKSFVCKQYGTILNAVLAYLEFKADLTHGAFSPLLCHLAKHCEKHGVEIPWVGPPEGRGNTSATWKSATSVARGCIASLSKWLLSVDAESCETTSDVALLSVIHFVDSHFVWRTWGTVTTMLFEIDRVIIDATPGVFPFSDIFSAKVTVGKRSLKNVQSIANQVGDIDLKKTSVDVQLAMLDICANFTMVAINRGVGPQRANWFQLMPLADKFDACKSDLLSIKSELQRSDGISEELVYDLVLFGVAGSKLAYLASA